MSIIKKQDLLMNTLIEFYLKKKNRQNLNDLLNILNGTLNISLRIIDWFVTNYSKKNNIYWIHNNERFVVYLNYKNQLKAYSKKQFDPFCRRDRIMFYYDTVDACQKELCQEDTNDNYIITTVGQLNFFKWAIKYNIIKYITENLEDIENDMQKCLKYIYTKDNNKIRKKRKELSVCATNTLNKHNVEIILNFD
tara:strand:- start:432 stop:1013 length:582 start_codon:yes stop_codon:yes gene_type:complete